MRLLVASRFVPLLAFTAVLVGCTDFDRPVVPKRDEPRFSQMAASAAGRIVFHSNRDGPFQIYSIVFLFLVLCAVLFTLTRRP